MLCVIFNRWHQYVKTSEELLRALRTKSETSDITDAEIRLPSSSQLDEYSRRITAFALRLYQEEPDHSESAQTPGPSDTSGKAVEAAAAAAPPSDLVQLLGSASELAVDDSTVQDDIAEDLAALAEQLKYSSLRMRELVQGDTQVRRSVVFVVVAVAVVFVFDVY